HGLGLARDDVDALNRAVEGWAAGLQLAAIDSRSGRTAGSQRAHPGAFEYLAGEVFATQDAALQAFLLRTSIVDRISPSLADALTDDPDSDARLEALRGDHLFTSLIDPGVPLYRYHHLFQEFLRQRLHQVHPELEPELHTRAARWFLHERSGD